MDRKGEGSCIMWWANQKRHADEAVVSREAAVTGPLLSHAGDHRGGGRPGEPRGREEPPQGEEAQLEKLVAPFVLVPLATQRGARPQLRGHQ